MQIKLAFAPWLPLAIELMIKLSLMGYRFTDEEIAELMQSAIVVAIE